MIGCREERENRKEIQMTGKGTRGENEEKRRKMVKEKGSEGMGVGEGDSEENVKYGNWRT